VRDPLDKLAANPQPHCRAPRVLKTVSRVAVQSPSLSVSEDVAGHAREQQWSGPEAKVRADHVPQCAKHAAGLHPRAHVELEDVRRGVREAKLHDTARPAVVDADTVELVKDGVHALGREAAALVLELLLPVAKEERLEHATLHVQSLEA